MDLKTIKNHCLSKKGAYEDYPFGPEPLVIKVQSKMFALISQKADKVSISLKCDPFLAQDLRQQHKSVTPGYRLNKEHWNTITLYDSIPESEIFWLVDHSYGLVVKGLSSEEKINLIKT